MERTPGADSPRADRAGAHDKGAVRAGRGGVHGPGPAAGCLAAARRAGGRPGRARRLHLIARIESGAVEIADAGPASAAIHASRVRNAQHVVGRRPTCRARHSPLEAVGADLTLAPTASRLPREKAEG